MGPKAQVGIYTRSKKSIAVLILERNEMETKIAVGQGVKGGAIQTVPSSAVKPLSSSLSFAMNSSMVNRHCEGQAPLVPSASGEDSLPFAQSSPSQVSSVALLQAMMVAPFDSVTQWVQPGVTAAFVFITAFVFLLKNAYWLFPALPSLISRFVNDASSLEPLLFLTAGALTIASSYHALDGTFQTSPGAENRATVFWRWLALLPLIVVTAVGTIHRDWSPHAQQTSYLGQFVGSVYPWLEVSVDETCLYTVASIAVLRKITRSTGHTGSSGL
jgi:hypothetical protein